MRPASVIAQRAPELDGKGRGKGCRGAKKRKELPVSVYVFSGGEEDGGRARLSRQVLRKGREEIGGLPR